MFARRAALALFVSFSLLAAGCSADTADDFNPSDDEIGTGSDAVTSATCPLSDWALFFHGMHGHGRELATEHLCLPKIDNSGANGFFGGVAYVQANASRVVGGYSAGRIPLIRRLAKDEAGEKTAVLLDPSYSDGARFGGKTGPAIVNAWLDANPNRKFVLVYSPRSTGWREYAALLNGPYAEQVRVCALDAGHLELPRLVGSRLFLDTDAWLDESCVR